eukprot:sb/3479244/
MKRGAVSETAYFAVCCAQKTSKFEWVIQKSVLREQITEFFQIFFTVGFRRPSPRAQVELYDRLSLKIGIKNRKKPSNEVLKIVHFIDSRVGWDS